MRWALSMRRKLRWCMPNWWTTPLPMPSTTWAPTLWGLWSITHPSPWPKCCQWWTRSSIRCTRLGPAWTVPEVARLLLCPTRTQSSHTQPMARSPWSGQRILNWPETGPRATADRIRLIRHGAALGTSLVGPVPGQDPAQSLAGQRKVGRSKPPVSPPGTSSASSAAKARSWGCSSANTAASCSWTTSCTPSTWAATVTETHSSATSAATAAKIATSSPRTSSAENTPFVKNPTHSRSQLTAEALREHRSADIWRFGSNRKFSCWSCLKIFVLGEGMSMIILWRFFVLKFFCFFLPHTLFIVAYVLNLPTKQLCVI